MSVIGHTGHTLTLLFSLPDKSCGASEISILIVLLGVVFYPLTGIRDASVSSRRHFAHVCACWASEWVVWDVTPRWHAYCFLCHFLLSGMCCMCFPPRLFCILKVRVHSVYMYPALWMHAHLFSTNNKSNVNMWPQQWPIIKRKKKCAHALINP